MYHVGKKIQIIPIHISGITKENVISFELGGRVGEVGRVVYTPLKISRSACIVPSCTEGLRMRNSNGGFVKGDPFIPWTGVQHHNTRHSSTVAWRALIARPSPQKDSSMKASYSFFKALQASIHERSKEFNSSMCNSEFTSGNSIQSTRRNKKI